MLLVLKCLGVAFATGYLIGVPLLWLARLGKPLSERDWLYAPFVGLGAATLLTQQLAYFDVRVGWSAGVVWGAAVLLAVTLAARHGARTPFRHCPRAALGMTLAVYLIHSLGLLLANSEYVGRLHTDRTNYISVAQFLIDVPFSTSWDELGQRPYLADGLKLKTDRIGVMALLAFFSVSTGEAADRLFEPTILLGPALVVPGVLLCCRALRFSRTESHLAAFAGGLAPGLATLHTLGFLANVVAIPFLFAVVAALGAVLVAPSPRRLILTAVLTTTTVLLYTEFTGLLLPILVAGAVFAALFARCGWVRPFAIAAAVVALSLAITPRGGDVDVFAPIARIFANTRSGNFLSWLPFHRLLGAAWVGELMATVRNPFWMYASWIAGGLLTLVSAIGAIGILWKAAFGPPPRRGERRVVGPIVACLALGPLLMMVDGKFAYQASKVYLSLIPMMVVCAVSALCLLRTPASAPEEARQWAGVANSLRPREWAHPATSGWVQRSLIGLTCVFALGTASLVNALSLTTLIPYSNQLAVKDPGLQFLKLNLNAIPRNNVILAVGSSALLNSDMSFAARRHQVWLVCPEINDGHAVGCPTHPTLRPLGEGRHLVDLNNLPREALVYAVTSPNALVRIEGDKRLVHDLGRFSIWKVGPGPYRLIPTAAAKRPGYLDESAPAARHMSRTDAQDSFASALGQFLP